MSDRQVDDATRAAQQKAATRTAVILAAVAFGIYAWVFISKL